MKENNIVTLNGENGKSLDFRIEAELEYDGYLYQILRPLKKYNDLNDEAIVFRVEYTSNYGYEYSAYQGITQLLHFVKYIHTIRL